MTDPIFEQEPKLAEIVRRLVVAYQPERIYLFGSVARGDTGPNSDYDLLVIVPDDAPPERRDGGLAYRALWGVGTAVDAVVCTSRWFHARTHLKASLPGTVLREERLLHAA
jgi:predicted nucleotidyltransferase